ncbi:MAG: hypothetical protein IKK39_08775 [Thermoguttaceae bacterium]|nr:hypothetical protein [Thermoguttaceae bacterium]
MNPLYRLFFRSGTKEALFAALWLSLDERPGVGRDLSAASLVALAARYGVVLTEPQTRKRLADLEAVGVVAIERRRERGRFDLLVYAPAPEPESDAPKPTPPERETLFAAAFGPSRPDLRALEAERTAERDAFYFGARSRIGNEIGNERGNDVENQAENAAANASQVDKTPTFAPRPESSEPRSRRNVAPPPLEEIKININNKKINKPAKVGKDISALRERLPFDDPKIARLRAEIVRRVWERGVNPDLIDRLTAAVALRVGGTTFKSLCDAISEAVAERDRWRRTDGARGKRRVWETLGYYVKRLYEADGWEWVPTRIADEPPPRAPEASVARSTSDAEPTETLSAEELAELGLPPGLKIIAPPKPKIRATRRRRELAAIC